MTEGEEARFLAHAETLRALQRRRQAKGRALHLKQTLGVLGQLAIDDGLPEPARHGLGAKPGRYEVWVRVSNGAGARQHDKQGDIRGFAVKVLGVEGQKLIPGLESARTQDFLFINSPVTAVRNADEFLAVIRAMQSPPLFLPRLIGAVGLGRALRIVKNAVGALGAKVTSVATTAYFSAAPLRWGPYAVKVSLAPQAPADANAQRGSGPDWLGDELAARLKAGPVVYALRLQHYTDPTATPIEEHDRPWEAPWLTVGTLTLPQQDVASEAGRALQATIEQASFDPWHALVEHRPLGNMMRARNHAYRLSTQERGAAPEPAGPRA